MELSYRPEYDSFRIECNRSEYEAVLEAVRWMVRHGEIRISDNDLAMMDKMLQEHKNTNK
jgi:hypothetical protein